jgi:NAD(P)-dependent dehydrogenase (short-subunit alcohol dehydrogenase family)
MDFNGRHVVVTGGGSGIGAALVQRFAAEDPRGIVVVDIDGDRARFAAAQAGGIAIRADIGHESEIQRVIAEAENYFGPVDVWVSNAGVVRPLGGPEIGDAGWQRQWEIHVMSHVWAARALLPGMLGRDSGYLINIASCAGLLTIPGAMPYTVTKHAAVALAESLAVVYGNTGIRFSCVCPGMVDTPMPSDVDNEPAGRAARIASMTISADQAAESIMQGLDRERFMILTHAEETSAAAKLRAVDPDGYVAAVQDIWHAATMGWVPAR